MTCINTHACNFATSKYTRVSTKRDHMYTHTFMGMHVCLIMNAYQFLMLMFEIKPPKHSLWYELCIIPPCGLTCAILLGHNAIYYGENIKVS